jgi:hypothetical protein
MAVDNYGNPTAYENDSPIRVGIQRLGRWERGSHLLYTCVGHDDTLEWRRTGFGRLATSNLQHRSAAVLRCCAILDRIMECVNVAWPRA